MSLPNVFKTCCLLLAVVVQSANVHGGAPQTVPDWTADAVWYQVFVTRFCNGSASNDPPGTQPWNSDWAHPGADDPLPLETQLYFRSYGGDLQGLRSKFDYLANLGVNTLYLNPIFAAASQHKYDTADHRHIDDTLAIAGSAAQLTGETADPATWQWSRSDRYFLDLVKEAHARGMRVVLDGVFNHAGRDFWAFRDVVEHGKASRFADWFDVTDWGPPLQYAAWDGPNGHLPRFHRAGDGLHPDVERYLFAVVRRWMDPDGDGDPRGGIDGWRLDAADRVPHGFWRRFREVVKTINPDAVIVGEIWIDASPWLAGDQFDCVTNYCFSRPVIDFLKADASPTATTALADALTKLADRHPLSVDRAMMNLLDSHDTARTVTMLLDPANYRSNSGEPIPLRNLLIPSGDAYRRQALAVLIQYTWVGAPIVYYGDELGMYGGGDPYCRAPMCWERLQVNGFPGGLPGPYLSLGRLRERPELRRGACRVLLADDARRLFVYERVLSDSRCIVAINAGPDRQSLSLQVDSNTEWNDLSIPQPSGFDPGRGPERPRISPDGRLQCTLDGLSGLILTNRPGE